MIILMVAGCPKGLQQGVHYISDRVTIRGYPIVAELPRFENVGKHFPSRYRILETVTWIAAQVGAEGAKASIYNLFALTE